MLSIDIANPVRVSVQECGYLIPVFLGGSKRSFPQAQREHPNPVRLIHERVGNGRQAFVAAQADQFPVIPVIEPFLNSRSGTTSVPGSSGSLVFRMFMRIP